MEKVLLVYSLLFAFAVITCSATTYTVGDSSGWDISTNLDTWVADKKFKVGDALLFLYSSANGLDEVTREDFNTCNTTNPLTNYVNGNTTVPLTKAGDRYFVCGNKLYCLGGMKLHVHVEDDKSLSPTLAPASAAGPNQRTTTLAQSPSSKKNTHVSKGVVNCARDALQLVYIVLMVTVYGMLQN
ncbi:stellacyanin-like [Gastrolobium bilobum]|uniref:stellacyanin-like n=1 Tax=Gastrolobium bilobum TaxID=150636 RepID=UPI002AAFEA23|nr:stellacyanin-like [Gastrolobium bilobum]